MTPEVIYVLFGSCIAGGGVVGAVVSFVNSWRA